MTVRTILQCAARTDRSAAGDKPALSCADFGSAENVHRDETLKGVHR
jgi:hypothetical protein